MDDMTRIDALRALLAKPDDDNLRRSHVYTFPQPNDRKLRIASRAWVEQVRASWDRRTA